MKPTIGRIVHFTPGQHQPTARIVDSSGKPQPLAAIICGIWSENCVNLAAFDANGSPLSATSVPLVQEGDPKPDSYFCEWPPRA
jgi:hypothetical protein